ncbi:fimbrial protein [Chromobacterium sp. LK1]|uniref:fimbrial protein n=1 Tax=Chromobacterium sp. LK1 TaxID=1628193 RepID=UPI000B261888|nr:fimbrial protein [Chromobacterium sp. LK1]
MWHWSGVATALLTLLLSGMAGAGPCEPVEAAQKFSVLFDKTFTKPEDNAIGMVFPNAYTWDLGTYYPGRCACTGTSSRSDTFFTTKTSLIAREIRVVDGRSVQFYEINRNLQVATEIFIVGGKGFMPTPWVDLNNGNQGSEPCRNGFVSPIHFGTGSKGRVHLLISYPFVGTLAVPEFKVLDLYAVRSDPKPAATKSIMGLYMSMNVTVPQNCKLVPGQQTSIDFGSLMPSQLVSPGAAGQKVVNRNFQIQCSNISAGVKINLALEGRPHGQAPRYLETTHQDVAVAMESGGKLVAPTLLGAIPIANQLIPITLDYQSQKAQFDLSAWPVKMRPRPQPGAFQGSATLKFDFE